MKLKTLLKVIYSMEKIRIQTLKYELLYEGLCKNVDFEVSGYNVEEVCQGPNDTLLITLS